MKKFTYFLTATVVVALASCSTSNDVVSKSGIQKRKYNQGFYVDAVGNQSADAIAEAKAKSASAGEWINSTDEAITSSTVEQNSADYVAPMITSYPAAPAVDKMAPVTAKVVNGFKGVAKGAMSVLNFSEKASVYSDNSATTSLAVVKDSDLIRKGIILALVGLLMIILGYVLIVVLIAVWPAFIAYLGWLLWLVGVILVILGFVK